MTEKTPLAAVGQGLVAGLIGNAVFTGYQAMQAKLASGNGNPGGESDPPRDWSDTTEPAQLGHRVIEGVFDKEVPLSRAEALGNGVHWLYGTSWGAFYGVFQETFQKRITGGVALTSVVMAFDYTVLPAMKLYKPPWKYPVSTLAKDYGNHLVYGLSVAAAYRMLDAVGRR